VDYRIGKCSLQSEERVLRCNGDVIPLPPRAVDTLIALAAQEGAVVPKEALLEAVWHGAPVDEANLTQNIYRLRRVLGAYDPSVRLETVPRRGYRLTTGSHNPHAARRIRPSLAILAAVVATGILVGSAVFYERSRAGPVLVPPSYPIGYELLMHARSIAAVRKSMPYFERAIAEEPRSALGYAGLAEAHLSLAIREKNTAESLRDARAGVEIARQAVAIGANSSEAHAAFGQGEALYGDEMVGKRELQLAVQLDPYSPEARAWYGELLMGDGKITEAVVQLRAALQANPSWTDAADDLALLSYLQRNYRQAAAFATQSFAQEPRDRQAQFVLALANSQLQRHSLAERELRLLMTGRDAALILRARALLTWLYFKDRETALANREFDTAMRGVRALGIVRNPSTIISIAASLVLQHQSDVAFAWLARLDLPTRRLFAEDARLDGLRNDRRFTPWLRGS